MLRDMLEQNFPNEYNLQREKHTADGWINAWQRTDPTVKLIESAFPTVITLRLLRRLERLIWDKDEVTDDDVELFCEISDNIYATCHYQTDAVSFLPKGRRLKVQKSGKLYTIYQWGGTKFFDSWVEDQ